VRVPNGLEIYSGISKIDNSGPIVVIASGTARPSPNVKTGSMVQIYILRSDVPPLVAINQGLDYSICGSCPMRGEVIDGVNRKRACYVPVRNAPRGIFMGYQNGIYPKFDEKEHGALIEGKSLRLSAYGDPTAVPYEFWEDFLWYFDDYTGYTHFWKTADQRFRKILMASVHTLEEAQEAKKLGWRYFRSIIGSETLSQGEFYCPAAKGKKLGEVTCSTCLSCNGAQDKPNRFNPVIAPHGGRMAEANYHRKFQDVVGNPGKFPTPPIEVSTSLT
jgi:hypothetical protein